MKRVLGLAVAGALALAGPAFAGQFVSLKSDTASADRLVTLGDIFDGAGAAGVTPVAARNGATVTLNAQMVQAIAHRVGLDWPNAEGLRTIVVHGPNIGGGSAASPAAAARGNVQVLAYARSLTAGEIVQPQDVIWTKAAAAPPDGPSDAQAVIGLAAKRPLREGAAVCAHDLGAPQVIKAGEMVTVTFAADGVMLGLQGKAMSAAGVGEVLNVENGSSKKIIQSVVTGPGQAVVGPAADQLKAAGPARYALR